MKDKYNNYKKYGVNLLLILISLALLFVNERYLKSHDDFFYSLILTVSVSLLASAISSGLLSKLQASNSVEEVAHQEFSVLKCCTQYGLAGIYDTVPFDEDKFKDDFLRSKAVHIVMNDSKHFVSCNIELFNRRLTKKNSSTTFILQNYKRDDIMTILAQKKRS